MRLKLSTAFVKDCYKGLSWVSGSKYLILYIRYFFLLVSESFLLSSIFELRILSTSYRVFSSSIFNGGGDDILYLDKGSLLFK